MLRPRGWPLGHEGGPDRLSGSTVSSSAVSLEGSGSLLVSGPAPECRGKDWPCLGEYAIYAGQGGSFLIGVRRSPGMDGELGVMSSGSTRRTRVAPFMPAGQAVRVLWPAEAAGS